MSLPDDNELSEALQRDRLTAADEERLEAYLERHPDQRHACAEDQALNHLLRQASAPAISSNFTARVIRKALEDHEPRSAGQPAVSRSWLNRWFPQLTAITAALAIAGLSYHQHQLTQRRELARNLAEMTRLAAGTPLDVLGDFEAIERLNQVPRHVDKELLAALQ
jgi:anti-sigma factor RsiW